MPGCGPDVKNSLHESGSEDLVKLNDFKLERFFARYEFSARYLLCCSDCEAFHIQEILDLEPDSERAFKNCWLGYTESQGSPFLRAQIARLYEHCSPQEILVHSGAEEAIFHFMNVALAPGDHVIVQSPCYQSLQELPRAIGCEISLWELRPGSNGWGLDMDSLRKAVQKNTRALVINSPHNPTGHLLTRRELNEIVDLCRDHQILLFADEVYRYLEYREEDQLPWACDIYENAVSLGVMSKSFGLPGLRIGWIATRNQEIYRKMAAFKDYTSICSSAPSEFLAAVALRHYEQLVERNLQIIKNNLVHIDGFLAKNRELFTWIPPQASPIAFPRLNIKAGIDEFARELVEESGVLILPGTCYGMEQPFFRLGFGRRNFKEGLDELQCYLDRKIV